MAAGDWKRMLSAIYDGDINQVKYYIDEGINPNYQHPEFLTTPLIESIAYEQYEIAKYLLENGADPSLKAGFSTENPLTTARKTNNNEILQLVNSYLPKKRMFFMDFVDKIFK